jgi:hypothetical protein
MSVFSVGGSSPPAARTARRSANTSSRSRRLISCRQNAGVKGKRVRAKAGATRREA